MRLKSQKKYEKNHLPKCPYKKIKELEHKIQCLTHENNQLTIQNTLYKNELDQLHAHKLTIVDYQKEINHDIVEFTNNMISMIQHPTNQQYFSAGLDGIREFMKITKQHVLTSTNDNHHVLIDILSTKLDVDKLHEFIEIADEYDINKHQAIEIVFTGITAIYQQIGTTIQTLVNPNDFAILQQHVLNNGLFGF